MRPNSTDAPAPMKNALSIFILSLAVAIAADAQTNRREALAQRLAIAMGLDIALEEAKRQSLEDASAQGRQLLAQAKMAKLPPDVEAELLKYSEEYNRRVAESWSSKLAASIYISALVEDLTDDEIADAVAYFSSTQGKRANEAIQAANGKLSQYIRTQSDEAAEREGKIFVEKILSLRKRMNNAAGGSK
jgi:hypothetical protein